MATTRHTGADFEAGRVHRQQGDRIPEMEQTGDDTGVAQRLPRVAPSPLAAEGLEPRLERLPVAANHRQHGSPARFTRASPLASIAASPRDERADARAEARQHEDDLSAVLRKPFLDNYNSGPAAPYKSSMGAAGEGHHHGRVRTSITDSGCCT